LIVFSFTPANNLTRFANRTAVLVSRAYPSAIAQIADRTWCEVVSGRPIAESIVVAITPTNNLTGLADRATVFRPDRQLNRIKEIENNVWNSVMTLRTVSTTIPSTTSPTAYAAGSLKRTYMRPTHGYGHRILQV